MMYRGPRGISAISYSTIIVYIKVLLARIMTFTPPSIRADIWIYDRAKIRRLQQSIDRANGCCAAIAAPSRQTLPQTCTLYRVYLEGLKLYTDIQMIVIVYVVYAHGTFYYWLSSEVILTTRRFCHIIKKTIFLLPTCRFLFFYLNPRGTGL